MHSPRSPEPLPKATLFATSGVLLSLGAPLGLLIVRCFAAETWPHFDFIGAQIKSDPLLYGYMTFATMLMFFVLGRTLGAREDQLAKTSITDPLTQLHNRRHLYKRVEEELARVARHEEAFVLLLVDVDHLKVINDRGGHEAGDRALVCVANALRKTCRVTDLPARFGGDEFVVLLPSTTSAQALNLCERIQGAVRQCVHLPIPLTVSIGVAEAGPTTASAAKLIEVADSALYAAKAAGRDRVHVAESAPLETHEPAS